MKRMLVLVCAALAVFFARDLSAQQPEPPTIQARVEPRDVEVGEPFSISLSVMADASGPPPTNPQLAMTEGLRTGPPSVSSQTQISIVNGRFSRRSGFDATWQVMAAREGVFVVTPSVMWNGKKLQRPPLRITVHAATPGGRARRQAPQVAPNPFDPFGMFPRLPGIFDAPELNLPPAAPADPEVALDAPLDPNVFLRAVVDKKTAIVGQQITLTVYYYARTLAFQLSDLHEPSVPAFFLRDLISPDAQFEPQPIVIGGTAWRVQAVFKKALFPLQAGELEIGPVRGSVVGRGTGISGPMHRETQAMKISVAEPPLVGRPVGYQIGDVGSYSLAVTVDPRTSQVGDAVAVTANLSGVGNVPNTIRVPASSSVEWLEPKVRENLEVENGKIKGSRVFTYVVRPKTPGIVDLGDVTLSFWNPEHNAYEIARASLGKIQVAIGKNAPIGKESEVTQDPWSSIGPARAELGSFPRGRDPLTDRPFYWLGLFGGPLAIVVGSLGSRGFRRARSWLAAKRISAESGIDKALAQARDARKRDDPAALAAALERAVYLSIERSTALKARALLLHEIPAALEARAIPPDLASDLRDLLSSIEAIRFTPDRAPGAGDLADRVVAALRRLNRLPAAARV